LPENKVNQNLTSNYVYTRLKWYRLEQEGFFGRAFAISVCLSVCPSVHLFVTIVSNAHPVYSPVHQATSNNSTVT